MNTLLCISRLVADQIRLVMWCAIYFLFSFAITMSRFGSVSKKWNLCGKHMCPYVFLSHSRHHNFCSIWTRSRKRGTVPSINICLIFLLEKFKLAVSFNTKMFLFEFHCKQHNERIAKIYNILLNLLFNDKKLL